MDDDRLSRIEIAIRDLEQIVGRLDRRLEVLERGAAALSALEVAVTDDRHNALDLAPSAPPAFSRDSLVTLLSFIGRTCVALGGAYLLRALTDAAVIPLPAGIALGLVYALGLLILSDRAGAAKRGTSAAFHGFVATIIAFPLIWESVTRFQLLTPNTAALALALVTALTLATALRQRSQPLAWIAVVVSLTTMLALVAATGALLLFAGVAVALGVATLWIGYEADWVLLRWPVTLVADLMVLALAVRATNVNRPDPRALVIALQLLLLAVHLVSVATRTLVRGRDVNPFEVLQTVAALGVGFGGAVYVAQATGFGTSLLASMSLLIGASCYGVAFAFLSRTLGVRRNFYFYTSLGLILVLVSLALLLSDATAALTWTALGVLATWLALRTSRITLNTHAAVYLLAAASASGMVAAATAALVGAPDALWPPIAPAALAVLAGAAACWAIPLGRHSATSTFAHVPRLLVTILLVWSAGGWLISLIAPTLPGVAGHPDAGILATIRTSVLAAAALALAWAGRFERFRESAWLLYPTLGIGGLKLLVEDLPRSRPATLFVALALFGGALIVAPRLSRGAGIAAPPTRA